MPTSDPKFRGHEEGIIFLPPPPSPPLPFASLCIAFLFGIFFAFFSVLCVFCLLFSSVCGFLCLRFRFFASARFASLPCGFLGLLFLGVLVPVAFRPRSPLLGVRPCCVGSVYSVVSLASLASVCPRVLCSASLPPFARPAFVAWSAMGLYVGDFLWSSRLWVARSLVSFRRVFGSSFGSRSAFLSAWASAGCLPASSFFYRF